MTQSHNHAQSQRNDRRYLSELVNLHLELVPHFDLGISFDPAKFLAEATALQNRYVALRNYNEPDADNWRGIALHALDGDETRVVTDQNDAARPNHHFRPTKAALESPYLFGLVKRVFDLPHCRWVNLLWLAPGATVPPHDDGIGPRVVRSVNIALNMPTACEFWADIGYDGTVHSWSKQVPFQPGRAQMINVALPHAVYNRSDQARIHLVGRGSVRIPEEALLQLAQTESGITDELELTRRLLDKFQTLGRMRDVEPLFNELVARL